MTMARTRVSQERRSINGNRFTGQVAEAGFVHLVDEISGLLEFNRQEEGC
jgi:hypothetical protein